jgi:hypothetical protein
MPTVTATYPEQTATVGLDGLIEALTILRKYGNPDHPTHCEHDVLSITPLIRPGDVTEEDRKKLDKLGFIAGSDGDEYFYSYRYGSC